MNAPPPPPSQTTPPTRPVPPTTESIAATLGACLNQNDYGIDLTWGDKTVFEHADGIAWLPDWGVIEVRGDDASRFLHSQITQDVLKLGPNQARWGGYCSVKGRLLATFVFWRHADSLLLLTAQPVIPALIQRLKMYVLRAKVHISDARDHWSVLGLFGARVAAQAGQAVGLTVPTQEAVHSGPDAHLVRLPTCEALQEHARHLLVVRPTEVAPVWHALVPDAPPMSSAAWRRTEILCGIPRVIPATSDQFVPQMLNFESVGGVSFTKGCYPGQEIVARSQYLGKLKRRMFLARGDGPIPAPGSDITTPLQTEPCGRVVEAAPEGGQKFVVLFEAPITTVEHGSLHAGSAPLTLLPLPYTLNALT